MTGDERARFCGSCHKNVYDISQMTRDEAYNLIAKKEGNLCLRLHRRPDGTVITSDCPVGIAATPRPSPWGVAALVALIGSGLAGCAAPVEVAGDVSQVSALDNRKVESPPIAPTQVETPPMDFGNVESVLITNASASDGDHSGVTMGVPMPPPPPESAPTPQPTNAPFMGKPTMGQPLTGEPTVPHAATETTTTRGDIAPIYPDQR